MNSQNKICQVKNLDFPKDFYTLLLYLFWVFGIKLTFYSLKFLCSIFINTIDHDSFKIIALFSWKLDFSSEKIIKWFRYLKEMNHYRRTVFHCVPVPVSQNCLGKKKWRKKKVRRSVFANLKTLHAVFLFTLRGQSIYKNATGLKWGRIVQKRSR